MSEPFGDLAKRLRTARTRKLLTQEELAEFSGIGRATIARLEAGGLQPRMKTIRALARALELDPRELVPDPESIWPATGR